jgi:hypothetical protein
MTEKEAQEVVGVIIKTSRKVFNLSKVVRNLLVEHKWWCDCQK